VVDVDKIHENDFNLNIPRYVDIVEPEEPVACYQEAVKAGQEAEEKLSDHLRRLGILTG
jgi:type I restriction-modification system DNA methylase subunit